jgi:phosphatidylserine/phosphatidylglycerophosphate/cardiolipin synthase-like enzyme
MKRLSIAMILLISLTLAGCSNTANTTPTAATATSATSTSAHIQYYFPRAGQHPDQALISVINSANNTLDIAIYSLTKKEIVNAIAADEKRGVKVRIITDQTEAKNKSQAQELSILSKAGIPIKINTHSGLMHLKMTIADYSVLTAGSYNFSQAATSENDEVLLVIQDPVMAQSWDNEFNTMWNDNANYSNWR